MTERFAWKVLIPGAIVALVSAVFDLDLPLGLAVMALVIAAEPCECERGRP